MEAEPPRGYRDEGLVHKGRIFVQFIRGVPEGLEKPHEQIDQTDGEDRAGHDRQIDLQTGNQRMQKVANADPQANQDGPDRGKDQRKEEDCKPHTNHPKEITLVWGKGTTDQAICQECVSPAVLL
jgi:hypothetical protein